jgi:DNA modification methylase
MPGGLMCINVGDATRTIGDQFQLYPSHARIVQRFQEMEYQSLPEILWRKQTNAPNKFMGSGMLPPGAYITLEHEHILIFRKGGKRTFSSQSEKELRKKSAYFWEERNNWFSDLWELKGTTQILEKGESRKRSAAFPFEIAYRLINMFSIQGDTIIDPFLGTGTSMLAAMASCRNSIGVELDKTLEPSILERIKVAVQSCNNYTENRLKAHIEFVHTRLSKNKELKYRNQFFDFPVVTGQETELKIPFLTHVSRLHEGQFKVEYEDRIPLNNNSNTNETIYSVLHKPQKNKGLLEWVT